MRLTTVLDPRLFPEAERSALRLDGDAFSLGDATVPCDLPVVPAVRAESIAAEGARLGLVAAGRTAAWVHGAEPRLLRPHLWTVDVTGGPRTRAAPLAREVRYHGVGVERLGGLLVTTPLRTAFDLVQPDPLDADAVAIAARLVTATGLCAADIEATALTFTRVAHRFRTIARLAALAEPRVAAS